MKSIFFVAAMLLTVLLTTVTASAYEIDGDISDWGVNLSEDWNDVETWVPNVWSVDWVVEDNVDPEYCKQPDRRKRPVCYATGVHVEGHGAQYSKYFEPMVNGAVSPKGGETADIEAMYFDSDQANAYFAIVVSLPSFTMGDIAIDLDKDGVYEYGIPTRDHNKLKAGYVYKAKIWAPEPDNTDAGPYRMWRADGQGTPGEIAYVDIGIPDHKGRNWIIEIKAPRSALGNPSEGNISSIHTTMRCGNDEIGIGHAEWTEIPEFSTIVLPAAIMFGIFYLYRRKGLNKK